MGQLRKASGKTANWLSRIRENNVFEINLKKYKETPEGVQNIIGLVGLTATIIFIFSILNILLLESVIKLQRVISLERLIQKSYPHFLKAD